MHLHKPYRNGVLRKLWNTTAVLLITGALAILSTAPAAIAQQRNDAATEEAYAHLLTFVDAGADAALLIPDLKALNDQMIVALEGMNRVNLLLGSRPIDQAKAALDLGPGINERGGAAVVMYFNRGGYPLTFVALVPVTDAQTFLKRNFTPTEGKHAYKHRSGATVFARPVTEDHVLLSPFEDLFNNYNPQRGAEATYRRVLGEGGWQALQQGQAAMFSRSKYPAYLALAALRQRLPAAVADTVESIVDLVWEDLDAAAVTIDFDPLAIVLRPQWVLKQEAIEQAEALPSVEGEAAPTLRGLPSGEFIYAGSMTVADPLMRRLLLKELQWYGLPESIDPYEHVTRMDFFAPPVPASALPLAGGWAVLYSNQPRSTTAALEATFRGLDEHVPEMTATVRDAEFDAAPRVKVKEFEVDITGNSDRALILRLVLNALTGLPMQGYVADADDRVVLTDALEMKALMAGLEASTADDDSLAQNSIVRTMRPWLPEQRVFEMYFNGGHITRIVHASVKQAMAMLPEERRPELRLPEVSINTPPVAWGGARDGRVLTSSIVVPAAVSAPLLDLAATLARNAGADEPDVRNQPNPPQEQ